MTEQSTTVTVPTELLREFCARVNYPNTPQERLKEVLQAQLPREIEEGCRALTPARNEVVCGRPFEGMVLVKYADGAGEVLTFDVSELERID